VNDFKAMLSNLATVTENETYIAKALPDNTKKIMPNTPETYRRLIQHVREEKSYTTRTNRNRNERRE
jgi:hypothetical protein